MKIETVCREMYGAVGVEYTEQAEKRIEVSDYVHATDLVMTTHYEIQTYTNAGYGTLPVCMAKTQYSLSTDATKKGN